MPTESRLRGPRALSVGIKPQPTGLPVFPILSFLAGDLAGKMGQNLSRSHG